VGRCCRWEESIRNSFEEKAEVLHVRAADGLAREVCADRHRKGKRAAKTMHSATRYVKNIFAEGALCAAVRKDAQGGGEMFGGRCLRVRKKERRKRQSARKTPSAARRGGKRSEDTYASHATHQGKTERCLGEESHHTQHDGRRREAVTRRKKEKGSIALSKRGAHQRPTKAKGGNTEIQQKGWKTYLSRGGHENTTCIQKQAGKKELLLINPSLISKA